MTGARAVAAALLLTLAPPGHGAGAPPSSSPQARIAELRALAAKGEAGVAEIAAALSDPRGAVRAAAVQLLADLRGRDAAAAIAPLASDADEAVAIAAARALIEMGGEAAQGPVRKALASPSVRVRTQVAAYLGDARDTRFTKDLGALLADGVPGVRRSALEALRAMNDPASFPFLLPATLDEDEEIAAGAVRALAALGDGRALARIALLAGSPHAQVRAALAGAIPALGGLPVHAAAFDTLVSDADRSVRAAAATALRDHPSPEAGGPLQKLGKDAQATIRRIVVQAWREQPAGPAPAAALVGFLADADERVRATAILALGTRRPPGAAEAIAARAGDPSPVVREAIASTLGELEGDAAGDALARLATDSEPQVRAVAVVASAARGGSKALAIAEAAVEDESPVVRREAVRALGKVGSAGALARLRALAAAGDVPLRVAAIEQLGALKDRASLALLRKIAQEPVEAVRAAANRALTALGV